MKRKIKKIKVFERMYGEGKRNESGVPQYRQLLPPQEAATRLLCVYNGGNLQGRIALALT
ncbi:hypothetical protein SD81_036275 [Tolypothrix campylonemoides VB511288]|nr:hypothetical protein SD81_036275 [Tolypothrix campylonemoides VB511288]